MNKKRNIKAIALLALAIMVVLTFASCNTAKEAPAIKITVDDNPPAGDITVSAEVSGYTLGGDQGRIVYYLDTSVPTYYEHSAVSNAGTYAVSEDISHTWSGVTPGEHTFSVQLTNQEVMPLPAPVTNSVTITVGAPEGTPQLAISNPADGDTLPPGNILIVADVSSFMISAQDMGVINREGEGHLIYYIDEDPPTDAGAPAKTDTCAVSTDLSHLWKNIPQGLHKFAVQLVNNDDTPLDTPVIAMITLDVKP